MNSTNRTSSEQRLIDEHMEQLSRMAERGELKPIPGQSVYRGESAPAMAEDDLLAVFQGRPRQEQHQSVKKTWRIRTTEQLDAWAVAGAKEEHINTSALVRKAVAEYLILHHKTEQPA